MNKKMMGLALAGLAFATSASGQPAYTQDGKMLPPADYRSWIFLTSGFDMSYVDGPPATAHRFGNVFVDRLAYEAFVKTGLWPDKTVFVLESRAGSADDPLVKRGQFQAGPVLGLETHVKDAAKGGWAFYAFRDAGPAAMIARTATCYSCHQDHGQKDTTFTQYYPTLADGK
jgi:cytochrome c553